MKLWQKAAAVCAAVLAAVVAVCSAAMLLYARHTILDMTRRQVQTKQRDLVTSFSEMARYYLLDGDSDEVRRSLVNYCFSRFADETAVLTRGGETVSSALSIDPAKYADAGKGTDLYEGVVRDRQVMIAAESVRIQAEEYEVYTVRDVTDIHRSLMLMALIFAGVSLGGIGAGAGAVILLMRRGARPLAALSDAARRIAGGEYAIRAAVDTQDEIGALAADFNTMAAAVQTRVEELSETAERQRLFIGGVTHEFKTPLTALLLHTRLLRQVNMTEAERDRSLARIEQQCRWLERMIQALLKLITLRREDVDARPIPAGELLERVAQATEDMLAQRGAALRTDSDGGTLAVDPELMQSLLMNLVDNAAKAYDPQAADKTVWLTARGNVLQVRDAGRGIPPQAQERIFEPFYMVDKSRSKKNGGSGLGLALVRRIADAHGARLEVDSAPGQGTAVRVILPLQKNYN